MLVGAVLQTTLLDFKGLLKYLLQIQRKLVKPLKLDQTGSYWIILDHIRSDWIGSDRIGSDWIRLNRIGSDWIRLDQIESD